MKNHNHRMSWTERRKADLLKLKIFNDIGAPAWRPTGLSMMLENQQNFPVEHEETNISRE